ncbi:flavin reductase family protein [Mariniplasma anaerobium]|uniref:Flavin reductase n=1 Tax=Mariniplasma anaerobium TaxID=2735436 RepID=A0A7U9XUT6_9MOLU|nr:flavin reductase family protein [Mariniplasma anaerobium]BCR35237.1 flavin reductase [Mariniplasma anaerobium]
MYVEANKKNGLVQKPNVVVSVRDNKGRDNALVVAYACNCSYDPPMIMVGIVPSRFSYHMIKENGSFVVHLLDKSQTELYRVCGSLSGTDSDKLKEHHIKIKDALKVNAGIIEGCPVAIECKVVDSIKTGSHEMFVGEVMYVHAIKGSLNDKGMVDINKLNLL